MMKLRYSMMAALAATVWSFAAQPSSAAGEEQFETVKGWAITIRPDTSGSKTCFMARQYKDKDDNNAVNAVVAAVAESNLVISLVYEHWAWDKDKKVKVAMAFDKKLIDASSAWEGDAETLTGVFPDTIVPDLLRAKKIILRFDDGNADFDIAGFPDAFVALSRCERTVASAAAAAAPPVAPPSDLEMKYYFLGLAMQKSIKECEIGTTGRQRTGVDAKVSALAPRMTAVEASFREQLKTDPSFGCPSAAKAAKLEATIGKFVDLEPEPFFAALDDAVKAEEAAKAAADAETKAKAEREMRARIEAEIRAKVEAEMKAKAETPAPAPASAPAPETKP